MNTEIKYKNYFDEILTPQQVKHLNDEYFKEYYEYGFLKKREEFSATNELEHGEYFLSLNENINDVINEFKNVCKTGTYYFNKQLGQGFSLWQYVYYTGVSQLSKGKIVYNTEGKLIAHQEINHLNDQIIRTRKTYYLSNLDGFPDFDDLVARYGTLQFNYNHSSLLPGEICVWVNLTGFDHKEYYIKNNQNIFNHFMLSSLFPWTSHPYYHSASLLLPTSSTI
ncbi:hypothetical protein [Pedobacter glucosidilyticus]|uniref:hypothetical protein n=1 Tax=Pedobacter glucosidilyticus TaxID=1122941 RepID=UPI0004279EE5|nr:hypothetical protein [Pedobacter glucosidilyticus]